MATEEETSPVDKEFFNQLATLLKVNHTTDEGLAEFESIWKEMCHYEGCETYKIVIDLRERGFTDDEIHSFGLFFLIKGIQEVWILNELGF